MLDDNKKTLLKGSDFFAEQGLKIKNESRNPSAPPTNDPFYKMASSGNPKDQLYIAKNPNSTPEALLLLKDSKDRNIQKALAANPNSPQEVLDNLPKDVQGREALMREDIKTEWNEEFQKIEWDGSGSIDASSADSNLGTKNIASWLKESPMRREEMDRILNDPNTPESRKQILREKIKEAKKQNAEESRLDREAKQNAQAAKKQEEKQKQKEKEDLAKVKKEELAAAKKGEVSQENIKRGRALNFLVEGMDKDQRKDVDSSLKEEMTHLNKLAESKRKDELKRARKGDFSGVEIPEENAPLGSADIQHYKEIKKLKKQDELKRARKGDFSGIEIPEDTNSMSDTDKKYWEEISRRKKTKEQKVKRQEKTDTLKRARSGDFSGIEIPEDTNSMSDTDKKYWEEISRRKKTKEQKDERKENQNRKDNTETKPQQQKSFFQSDDEIEVQQDSEERINSFMYSSAVPQTQEIEGSNVINSLKSSLSSSKNDFKNITSDNAQYSKKSAENMDRLQNQIKDLDLKIRTQQNTKTSNPLQNTAAMSYSTNVTKSQQNTNRPIIKSDPITDLNQEYKEIPRFKNDLG